MIFKYFNRVLENKLSNSKGASGEYWQYCSKSMYIGTFINKCDINVKSKRKLNKNLDKR